MTHDEVFCPQWVQERDSNHGPELQTMCLLEKWRFVVLLGRIKESATVLREIHAAMEYEWAVVIWGRCRSMCSVCSET